MLAQRLGAPLNIEKKAITKAMEIQAPLEPEKISNPHQAPINIHGQQRFEEPPIKGKASTGNAKIQN